ncbi:MAG: dockerin type I repeat-containing protein, partial [Candidatus Theseobacter exili]|nr:dockerin type I repeat-containing protein [Candidatus Theseobacter exili]
QMNKQITVFFVIFIFCFTGMNFALAENHFTPVYATSTLCNFYGSVQINGLDIDIGDEVGAFDPTGVCCGSYVVDKAGLYGFIAVYGDDSTSPGIDEGAESGDTITFKIWDASEQTENIAITLGPTDPIWESMALPKIVNLGVGEIVESGDINNDKKVDISDVILCLRMAISLDTVNLSTADMNNDGVVDISDVILVLRKAVGLD